MGSSVRVVVVRGWQRWHRHSISQGLQGLAQTFQLRSADVHSGARAAESAGLRGVASAEGEGLEPDWLAKGSQQVAYGREQLVEHFEWSVGSSEGLPLQLLFQGI